MQVVRLLSFPFSFLYSIVLYLRNRFYDWGLFSSKPTPLKSIVVGNLSLGGTGKSPMTEYLIRHFSSREKVTIVSRGYGRTTKGQIEGNSHSSPEEIGDEPAEFARKFPEMSVFISSERHLALSEATKTKHTLAILDDAFQHRAVLGDLNILLTRFDTPWFKDWVLPMGNLRDHPLERKRADVVVVTNSPIELNQADTENFSRRLKVDCPVYFASTAYLPLQDIFDSSAHTWPKKVIALTGIANPKAFINEVKKQSSLLNHLKFPDHHAFSSGDVQRLHELIGSFADSEVAVVTTEKDASRLRKWREELKGITILAVPIEMKIHDDVNFRKYLDEKI
jgi:tetraacyldisaccharide 4'-kinase